MKLKNNTMVAIEMKFTKRNTAIAMLVSLLVVMTLLVGALPAAAADSPMLHNSNRFPATTKHGGAWGLPGTKYGEFDCSTCHARNTGNIKRVKKTITAPNSPTDKFPIEADATPPAGGIDFQDAREGSSDFGDDSVAGRSFGIDKSNKICEACHTFDASQAVGVKFHGYDMTVGGDPDHYNLGDCMTCHSHNQGFKPSSCNACHNASSALADSHGVHYNTATVVTAINTNNDSTAGNYIFQCGNCHSGTNHNAGVVSGVQAAEVSLAGTGTYSADAALAGTDVGAGGNFNYTAGTCNTNDCHQDGKGGAPNYNGATLQWSVTTLNCTGCHNSNAAATGNEMATGAHTAHMDDGAIMTDKSCQTCHDATLDVSDVAIADKTLHVNGVVNVAILGTYDGGNNYAANSCDAVYCHSDGKSTPNYVTVDWTTTIGDCVSCHGGPGTTTTLSASHLAHIGTDATDTNKQFGFTCDDCHAQTASSNINIGTVDNHVNQARDVAVSVANGGTGTIGGDFAAGSCATTLCHGSTTPDWTAGATTTGDCSACHGMEADSTDGRDTNGETLATDAQVGAHVVHLNPSISAPISCDQCHLTTVTNQTAAGTYVGKVNAVGHIDTTGPAELVWGGIADGGNDGQAAVTPTNDQAGCATTYCHDGSAIKNGWGGGTLAPTWTDTNFIQGSVADCDNCHGYPPAATHVANNDCSLCHDALNADDVTFTAAGKLTHVDGIVQSSGGDSCIDCHTTLNGAHDAHTTEALMLGTAKLSVEGYGGLANWYSASYVSGQPNFGCGLCHPKANTDHAGGSPTVNLAWNDTGATGSLKAENGDSAGYAGAGGACSQVYCHSDGKDTAVRVYGWQASPNWSGGTVSGNCNDCHANGPSSGTHANHIVGIHYETLYDTDGVGLMADSGATNAAHGDATTADTIGCQSCHNDTVAVEINDQNSVCSTCHDGSLAALQGNMTISTAGSTHVNGTPDVVFDTFASFKSKAQVRDDITTVTELNNNWTRNNGYKAANSFDQGKVATPSYAAGSCSNVSCHNGINTPTWNTGFLGDCRACHTTLP